MIVYNMGFRRKFESSDFHHDQEVFSDFGTTQD